MTKIKIDFTVGRMTQYILIKACIYIVFTSFLTLKSMDDNKNTDFEFHQYLMLTDKAWIIGIEKKNHVCQLVKYHWHIFETTVVPK